MKKAILNRNVKDLKFFQQVFDKNMASASSASNTTKASKYEVTPEILEHFKKKAGEKKQDVIKNFFVDTNKPVAVLPRNANNRLSYKLEKVRDNDVIYTDTNPMQRRSMSDLKASKLTSKL